MVLKNSGDGDEHANGTNGTMTKADAVRACLADDPGVSPSDAVVRIKERYGLEIETTVFSSYRSQFRARDEGRQAGQRGKATGSVAMRDLIAAVHAVKEVTDSHGIEVVRKVLALVDQYEGAIVTEVVGLIAAFAPLQEKGAAQGGEQTGRDSDLRTNPFSTSTAV